MLDAVVVGGSSAGLSAALVLGRSRRDVVVLDDGKPCNRFSHASHGFLTRDGVAPSDLVQIGREQLAQYTTVRMVATTATQVVPAAHGFSVHTADGAVYEARKVLLATGIRDILPDVPGIDAYWGSSVFHCPYCDGWEVRHQSLVVYNPTPSAFHQAIMLRQWTPNLTLCTGSAGVLTESQRDQLERHGVRLVEQPLARLEGVDGQIRRAVFADGSGVDCAAMFIRPAMEHRTTFAHDLGCALTEQGLVQVDVLGHTSVPGVYAAGDLSTPMRSVAVAVAQGSSAAAGLNFDLISEDFA